MARVCSPESNAANAALYRNKNRQFGPAFVRVQAVDAISNTVELIVNGVNVRCPWTDDHVMPLCPSTLEGSLDELPQVGATGTLYVSKRLIEEHNLAIYPKWPDAYAGTIKYRPLRIWPIKVEITGVEVATGMMTSNTIDLLDPYLAQAGQSLHLSHDVLSLQLSESGANRFHVTWITSKELQSAVDVINDVNDPSLARAKAKAWEAVAAWEELLAHPGARQHPDYQEFLMVLAQLKG